VLSCGDADPELRGEPRCDQVRLAAPAEGTSLVLVVNDTMRRDAAGVYGGSARTPHFDRFAREHLLFRNAVSQAPWTKPAIATLFTSLHPSQHRVASDPQMRDDKQRARPLLEVDVLARHFVTLAEVLRDAGFRTAGFVSNPWLEGRFGFAQGFDLYDDSFAAWGASGEAAVEAALAWLAQREPGQRFFLYLHLIDSHRPYGRIDPRDAEDLRRRTAGDPAPVGRDGELILDDMTLADGTPLRAAGFRPSRALFRRFLEPLEASAAWKRTAVVVTSDHGEALFERGYGLHGHGLYDDEAAVPMAVRLPGAEPQTGSVECLVGLVDLLPSFCEYLGVPCPEASQGWSFVRVGEGRPDGARRFLVTEGVMQRPRHRAIRNRSFKLLYEPGGRRDGRKRETPYSLFDLARDPGERFDTLEDLYGSERTERAFAVMREALIRAVAPTEAQPAERVPVDPALRERLEALGYLEE
jgi:arylsulfatase A-like enzyme